MQYTPKSYEELNYLQGSYFPSQVKAYNNQTFAFWERALFQRAQSVINIDTPEEWNGNIKDFLYYCLFKFGVVAVFDTAEYGISFQPCGLNGYNFYYQPTQAIVSNPKLQKTFEIGTDCEIVKLSPDYLPVWDTITYYAEKLSSLDSAINMSIINNKFPFILGARNKAVAQTLKKVMDKVQQGQPLVIVDDTLLNDRTDKDSPFQMLDREHLKNSYVTTDQLLDFQTLLNNFNTEIGIPTVPYQKKERMVTDEANSKVTESSARATIWVETLNRSFDVVNKHFGTSLKASLRYNYEGGIEDVDSENNANRN